MHVHADEHAAAHARGHGHWHGALGAVPVLDIGDGVGAIVAYLHENTPRGELDIRPAGNADGVFHTGVHERGDHFIAVFPEVAEGSYELLDPSLTPIARVDVKSGEVAEVHL